VNLRRSGSRRSARSWDERLKTAGPEEIRQQTFLAVRDLLLALARRAPLVLVLEDLHWADSLSLDLAAVVMETLTLAPILLVCVYRPEHEHPCWHLGAVARRKCLDRYTEITLHELSPQQSRRMVESLLRIDALPASLREEVLAKAQGNPFFVEEVIRSLIDSGTVYHDGDSWRAREGAVAIAVPETLQGVILGRVDRLEGEIKHVLQSAAVIGRLFRRRLVGQVTRQAEELDRALADLEDRALIYRDRVVPEEEYSFQHVLTQDTVYHNILRRRRVQIHRQVAEAMEVLYQDGLDEYYEQLAHHYMESEEREKALEYLVKAGDKCHVQEAPFVLEARELLDPPICLDRSILEVYANSRQCVTQRIFRSRTNSQSVALFARGGRARVTALDAWEIASTNPW
jgi:predicted ATPase